jgi:predicted transcriptional regulator
MKSTILTIRLSDELNKRLSKVARESGKSRSEIARELLRRYLQIQQFDSLRKRAMPFAEARGYLTDQDMFQDVS